jgi:hypothetical protein
LRETRTRLRRSALLIFLIVVAGCGGGGGSDRSAPALNAQVASRLASASDAIAESLDQNDVCTAAGRADQLRDAVVQAIQAGEVPPAFQEELLGRANELVNEVNCPAPPTTTQEEQQQGDHGNGKDKKNKKGEIVTVPTDTFTDTTLTDTTGGG